MTYKNNPRHTVFPLGNETPVNQALVLKNPGSNGHTGCPSPSPSHGDRYGIDRILQGKSWENSPTRIGDTCTTRITSTSNLGKIEMWNYVVRKLLV